jgi:hypothetical protein
MRLETIAIIPCKFVNAFGAYYICLNSKVLDPYNQISSYNNRVKVQGKDKNYMTKSIIIFIRSKQEQITFMPKDLTMKYIQMRNQGKRMLKNISLI